MNIFMQEIEKIVFPYEGVYEVIICTKSIITPIGIRFIKGKYFIHVYKNTKIHEVLIKEKEGVIVVTDKALQIYSALFRKFTRDDEIEIKGINCLKGNLAFEFKSSYESEDEQRTHLSVTISNPQVLSYPCMAINRANNLLIEILIHYTRINVFKDEKKQAELISLMKSLSEIAFRTDFKGEISEIIKKVIMMAEEKIKG
jgi:Uncharacterized conserved protein